jgi:hypothetical protein
MSTLPEEEVHSVVTTTHKLTKGDVLLVEEKKEILISTTSGKKLKEIHVHTRRIGNKSVTVTEEDGNKMEETQMTAEELKEFSEQWENEWTPTLTNDTITEAIQKASKN